MSTIRTSISISERLYREAQAAADAENFRSFSDYIEHLIREDWKARTSSAGEAAPPYRVTEAPAPVAAAAQAAATAGALVAPKKKPTSAPRKP